MTHSTPIKRLITLSAVFAEMSGHTVMTLAALPGEAEPPTEILLWEFGEVETTKGTFTITKEGAAAIAEKIAERGLDLAWDYEHATFQPNDNGPVPSAGWNKLEVRDDGVWLTDIKWTEEAYEMIKKREYRYFSPAFEVNDKNEIIDYYNCALTNLPATKNLKPLVASAREKMNGRAVDFRTVTTSMLSFDDIRRDLSELVRQAYSPDKYDTWVVEVYDEYAVFEKGGNYFKVPYTANDTGVTLTGDAVEVRRIYSEVQGGQVMKTLLVTLGLKESASEAEAVALAQGIMGQQTKLLSLTGAASVPEAFGTLEAWKGNSERLSSVEGELQTIKAGQDKTERENLIKTGMKEGRIPPAMEEYWMGQPTEAVKGFLSAAMPNSTTANNAAANGGNPSNPAAAPVTLSAAALDVAKAFGSDPVKLAEYQAKKGQVNG